MTQPDKEKSLSLDPRAARLEQRTDIAALIYLPKPTIPNIPSVQHLCRLSIAFFFNDRFAPLTLFVPEINSAVLSESCLATRHLC